MVQIHNLDTSGAIASPGALMKRLMENFMVSDKSQSFFYKDSVSSLRHVFSRFDNDLDALRVDITNAIEIMYSRYFDSVDIFVNTALNDDGVSVDVEISVSIISNGVPYSLSESVNTKNVLSLYDSK